MNNTIALYNTDIQLWAGAREHFRTKGPGGGPAFQVTTDGSINDGMEILARFKSKHAAENMLKAAGYHKVFYGWKA